MAVEHGEERVNKVRRSLHDLAQVLINGGIWNNNTFKPWTGSGNLHVVIVSHNNFLNFLTHRNRLPSKSSSEFLRYRS
jgi:hypothetical protein